MVAEAARRAGEAGVDGWTEHRVADAAALPFPSGAFDAVRAERVFQHLPDPERAFAELVRVTRPGGRVVVADTDYATVSVAAAAVDLERRLARFLGDRMVRNGYAARGLCQHFARHGLRERTVELVPLVLTDYALFRYGLLMDEVEAAAEAAGALSRAELDLLRAGWERAAAEGGFLYTDHGLLIAGRKP
jgi:SAM-dependent methyltransferase